MPQGTVKVIKPNKGGFYSTMMSDNSWYGGTKIPPHFGDGTNLNIGDEITFNITESNGFKNLDYSSLSKVENKAPSQAVVRSEGAGGAPRNSSEYWANKEARDVGKEERYIETQKIIQFQAARNTATSVLTLLLEQKVLPAFGGKKATHADQFADMLMDLTLRMSEEARAQGVVEGVAPIVSLPATDGDNE